MNSAEIKIDIINKITNITDISHLEELLQVMNFQRDESIFLTTYEDKDSIKEARKQIDSGEIISDSNLRNEISQWLKR